MSIRERVAMGHDGPSAAEILYNTIDANGVRALPEPTGAALKAETIDKIDAKIVEIDEHLAGSTVDLGEAVSQKFGEVDAKLEAVDDVVAGKVGEVNAAVSAAGTAADGATAAAGAADLARASIQGTADQLLAAPAITLGARDQAVEAAGSASEKVERVAKEYPTTGDWAHLELGPNDRPLGGKKVDGSDWAVRSGSLAQIAHAFMVDGRPTFDGRLAVPAGVDAPGLSVEYPTIGSWKEIILDASGRQSAGIKFDDTIWRAVAGVLVQVTPQQLLAQSVAATTGTFTDLTVSGSMSAPGLTAELPTIDNWDLLRLDPNGRISYGEKKDGTKWRAERGVLVKVDEASSSTGTGIAPAYSYDRNFGTAFNSDTAVWYMILINGQSWAAGGKNGATGDATVSTVAQHPGFALMPAPGVRPAGAAFTSLVDLREQETSSSYETPASGMADVIMTRLNARLGFKPKMIFASACLGGQAYWDTRPDPNKGLKRGTATYAEGLRIVEQVNALAKAAGARLVVLAQDINHGEQDFSDGLARELYQRALDQWHAHTNEDIRAITGQREPVRTYVTQVQRGGSAIGAPAAPAIAQLAAQERNPLIRCCGPVYQGPGGQPEDGNDGSHLLAVGYRMMGRLIGHFIVEDLLGPYEEPLRIVDRWWVSPTEIRLRYSKPLAIETTNALVNVTGITVGSTTYAGLGADGGVKFTDGSASPPAVSSIAVTGGDTLVVTLSGAPTGKNPRLTIAAHRPGNTGSGRERGARSAIRSAASFDTDPLTGVTQYFWACQEQPVLPPI